MMAGAPSIQQVQSSGDVAAATALFRAYEASLDTDLCFQGFEDEVAGLPGKYAAPTGALLIARTPEGEAVGCVALRPIEVADACEMKRLYVTPEGRGLGLGKALMLAAIGEARRIGYREMRLDTLPSMTIAAVMYREAGFVPIKPYYETPVCGIMFMALDLDGTASK